jgi:L-ascorbate metabolism protein UlaG (beta-lactamase superfamily)
MISVNPITLVVLESGTYWSLGNHDLSRSDSDSFPEMKNIKADSALLPIGGTSTMDEEEAANAAAAMSPKIVIPMHYGRSEIAAGYPEKFKALVHSKNPNINVVILNS